MTEILLLCFFKLIYKSSDFLLLILILFSLKNKVKISIMCYKLNCKLSIHMHMILSAKVTYEILIIMLFIDVKS